MVGIGNPLLRPLEMDTPLSPAWSYCQAYFCYFSENVTQNCSAMMPHPTPIWFRTVPYLDQCHVRSLFRHSKHLPQPFLCGFIVAKGDYMKKYRNSRTERSRKVKRTLGRPSIGIRELKAQASAIIDDVKGRRVSYAVTKRGRVEALIVPSDAGERLLNHRNSDNAWDAWQMVMDQLLKEAAKKRRSAIAELERMRR